MPAPEHTRLLLLRPLITEYPTPPPAPGRYPPPRKRGAITLPSGRRVDVGSPADSIKTVDVPTVRIYTFQLDTNASTRSTTSTGPLVGPAVIKSFNLTKGGAAGGLQSLEFGIAPAPVIEQDVSPNIPRQWTPITIPFDNRSGGDTTGRIGLPEPDFNAAIPSLNFWLGVPVMLPTFHLTVTNWSAGAAAQTFVGHVVIAEGVSEEALAGFV